MQKKHLALAVLAALAAPTAVLAQTSTVQIYGRAAGGFDNYSATGATAGSQFDYKARSRVYDIASRIGFRGTEDVGNGLKAVFQIESGVNLDTGTGNGQNGLANGSSGLLASRDSFVGLEGGMGRVTFGRQSIFYSNGAVAQTSSNYVNTEIPWTKGNVFGRVAGPAGRTSNVIAYNSPTVNGLNGTLSYAPNSEAAGVNTNTGANVWGLTMRYSGIVNIQWDYAVNQAASGGANQQKVTGNKLGLGWPYAKDAQISLIWTKNQNDDVAGTAGFSALHDKISQTAWTLNWEHMFGKLQALAMVGKLNAASGCSAMNGTANGCDGTTATGYMLGARYVLSKRTSAFLTYNKVTNGSNQIADYTNDGYTAASSAIAAGSDPRVIAVGMMHNF